MRWLRFSIGHLQKHFQRFYFPCFFAFSSPIINAMAITRRQREVYDFISRFVTEHGYSPSFEEIGQGLKLNSLATVHKHISNLEKKGLLTRVFFFRQKTAYEL